MHPFVALPGVGWVVRSTDLVVAATALLVLAVGPAWMRAAGRFGDDIPLRRICGVLFVVGFLGARLLYAAGDPARYWHTPLALLDPRAGGRHAPGAVIALLLVTPLVLRRHGIAIGRFMDAGVPVVCVALALARVGCLLHGCCVGRFGAWPWCVSYPHASALLRLETSLGWLPEDAVATHAVHLLPVYFALAALVVAAIAARLDAVKGFDWEVTAVATMLLGATNAALEAWRLEVPGRVYWGPWPHLVWANLAAALAGAAVFAVGRRRAARSSPAGARIGRSLNPHGESQLHRPVGTVGG